MHALLAAMMNPPADEAAFNAWYDEEHVPLRLAVPGFLSARRYRASTPDTDRKYLALYDLASLDVLQSEAYLRLPREPSDRERAMLASIPLTDRRVGELVLDCPEWTRDAPYQLLVCMTPASGQEADFVAWYQDEHIPLLLEVPGWRRARLFRQVEGSGPAFMAVHELESPDVFDHPAHEKAVGTPWRERIRQSVQRRERHLFALWRPMPPAHSSVAASATR
jgi:antibiotic biosynthesis monooxygenase (ABM) superfamily enzyme